MKRNNTKKTAPTRKTKSEEIENHQWKVAAEYLKKLIQEASLEELEEYVVTRNLHDIRDAQREVEKLKDIAHKGSYIAFKFLARLAVDISTFINSFVEGKKLLEMNRSYAFAEEFYETASGEPIVYDLKKWDFVEDLLIEEISHNFQDKSEDYYKYLQSLVTENSSIKTTRAGLSHCSDPTAMVVNFRTWLIQSRLDNEGHNIVRDLAGRSHCWPILIKSSQLKKTKKLTECMPELNLGKNISPAYSKSQINCAPAIEDITPRQLAAALFQFIDRRRSGYLERMLSGIWHESKAREIYSKLVDMVDREKGDKILSEEKKLYAIHNIMSQYYKRNELPDLSESTLNSWVNISLKYLKFLGGDNLEYLQKINCIKSKKIANRYSSLDSAVKKILKEGFETLVR